MASSSSVQAGDAHPKVVLDVDPCAAIDEADLRRILGVELDALLEPSDAPKSDAATAARVRCSSSELTLHVDDPITRKSLERAIDVSRADPKARSRLLALAIAELVSASWTELVANPEPAVEPVGPRPPPEVRKEVFALIERRSPKHALSLTADFTTRSFVPWIGPLFGGELRFVDHFPKFFAWSLSLGVDRGFADTALGKIGATTISAAPAVLFHGAAGPARIEGGIGLRAGAAWLEGEPAAPNVVKGTVAGPWLGPMLLLGTTIFLGRASATAGLEGGFVALPVGALVDGRRQVAIDGAWIGVWAGAGIAP